jgi:putative phage-type endonuclease
MTEFKMIKTAGMTRADWLRERKNGIGGSDVAALLGLNPYKTPLALFDEKTADAVEDKGAGEAAYWGTVLEDVVAREFGKRTGLKVQRVNFMLCRDGWMRANIDRAIVNPTIGKQVRPLVGGKAAEAGRMLSTDVILECKTANAHAAEQWGPSQLDEIVAGEVVTEHKIPLYYETQVQWYLGVTGAKRCYVAVLIGGSDFRAYEVVRDDNVIAAIQQRAEEFWKNLQQGIAPAPVNAEDIRKMYQKDDGEMREATADEAVLIGEMRDLNARAKQLDERKKAVANKLIFAIGAKAGLTLAGEKVCTYKAQTARRLDTKALRAAQPAIAAEFTKESTTRVLRLF